MTRWNGADRPYPRQGRVMMKLSPSAVFRSALRRPPSTTDRFGQTEAVRATFATHATLGAAG